MSDNFEFAAKWRACLGTKFAVTQVPCQHGYTWQCPHARDLVEVLVCARAEVLRRGASHSDDFVRLVEESLPWLIDRRKGPPDRRRSMRNQPAPRSGT